MFVSNRLRQVDRFIWWLGNRNEQCSLADIYNHAAIDGDFEGAQMDIYGNPLGSGFDLARDGAFEGFKILVLCAYLGEGLPEDLKAFTVPELSRKGFAVKICTTVDDFTKELRQHLYHVAWIISGNSFEGDQEAFLSEVQKFHEFGRGLMIWGDNSPFFVHANVVLRKLFGFQLEGNTPGGKELQPGDPLKPGFFGGHPKLCAGILKLHEGITLCYPNRVPHGWKVFGTSSNEKPLLLAKEASSERPGQSGSGRVVVDNGFTKIMRAQWTTAGTSRYVSNCSAWLVLRERFRRPQTLAPSRVCIQPTSPSGQIFMADIYNHAAIYGDFEGVQMDIYGNPSGSGFDLARDGAFEGFKILVLCAYLGQGLPDALETLTVSELSRKGFVVKICTTVDDFTQELRQHLYHVAWIISGDSFEGDQEAFLSEVQKFHEFGRGLMIWGDNSPWFAHANAVLQKLFEFELEGETPGGKELQPGDPLKPGFFGGHPKLCAGILKLHEGVTLCYPKTVPHGWKVFGTSSNEKPLLLAKEASSERPGISGTGRVIVDSGFTKIYKEHWTTAGTSRYVSNCSAWLVLRERFRHP
eukprot:symbB.v1.2.002187.t3/scaffold96.1/size336774/4